jgi:quercetin dioxygenase-like cupin family protein
MFYKLEDNSKNQVDNGTLILDYGLKDTPHDLVVMDLDGEHGVFVNKASTKTYYVLDGVACFSVDGKSRTLEKGDVIVVSPGQKHSMSGKMKTLVICTPPYNPDDEEMFSA